MTGLFEDYRLPAGLVRPQAPAGRHIGWDAILPHWRLVVADLARVYGVDLTDPTAWRRPWPPIRALILTLPGEPTSRLRAVLGGD